MGCGAIGGVLAGGLLRAGQQVAIVTGNEQITAAISSGGLRIATHQGAWAVPALAHTHVGEANGPFDIVYLAMKGTGVEAAARDVSSSLTPQGFVVTLQNGIVEDRVAEILGRQRVVGALVGWGATMDTPGIYEMTSRGQLVIGELDGHTTARVQHLKTILDTVTPTTVSTNIYGVLWSKLAINCALSPLGAVSGQLLGQLLRRGPIRRLGLATVSEVVDVAAAHGVSMEPVGGTLDIERLYLPPHRRGRRFGLDLVPRSAAILAVGLKFRRLKSSMLQSLERGRRAEIDFLNGYVTEKGQELGVPTPVNAALASMVREIETGSRPISAANLEDLLSTVP
jgi:2-dehydropantoate 2-reductase